jgi:acetyl-CoA synthetase
MGKPFKPSGVFIVEQLPRTRSTKVMRRLIRNVYTGNPLGDISALDNPSALNELTRVIALTNQASA